MEDEIVIRPAVASDAIGIESVARRTWDSTYTGIILPENQERLLGRYYSPAALEEAICQKSSWFFVATVQETIVGFAQFLMREGEEGRGELSRIYVLSEWQRLGIGERLLAEGLASLSQEGLKCLFVVVERDNLVGRRFYEKEGFKQIREFTVELPGQNLSLLDYQLVNMHMAG